MNPLTPYLGAIKAGIVVAAVLALFAFGAHTGANHVQAKWDKQTAAQVEAAAAADHENRVIESRYQSNVAKAQNEHTANIKQLQVSAATSRTQLVSVRHDLASVTADLPRATADACRQYAATANAVLGEMVEAGAGLAGEAQGHASDSMMYQQAWPK